VSVRRNWKARAMKLAGQVGFEVYMTPLRWQVNARRM